MVIGGQGRGQERGGRKQKAGDRKDRDVGKGEKSAVRFPVRALEH